MHLNYLWSPDTWILLCNECQNKWFSEWIPCIFGPEYGQSNAPKVKIRRPERSHSAVRPKIDPVSRAISTSTLACVQALHLWRARQTARDRVPRTCSPFACCYRVTSHDFPNWRACSQVTPTRDTELSTFQEAPSCAFSSWLLNMWDPITAPWLAPLLGTFGLGLLCW